MSKVLWFIIIGGLFFWMMRKGGCGMGHRGHGGHDSGGGRGEHSGHGGGSGQGSSQMIKDPVCEMFVDPKTSPVNSQHMGQTFYFCSPACKGNFDKEPMKYMKKESKRGGCCG